MRWIAGACLAAIMFISTTAHAGSCQSGYGWCPDRLGGGCAPMGSVCCPGATHVPRGSTCAPEVVGNWGAIAVALWRDGNGAARVATGVSWNYRTLSEASNAAMNNCRTRGGQGCQVVGKFSNGGCGYVATGTTSNGVRYGTGSTPSSAMDQCESSGANCRTPIGGCTSSPSD